MKILGPIAAGLLLFGLLQVAFADNGVERGDITFDSNNVPQAVQKQLQKLILQNCDLTGVKNIDTSYVNVDTSLTYLGRDTISYEIQYAARFPSEGRTVMIQVAATLNYEGRDVLTIEAFSSPICKSIP